MFLYIFGGFLGSGKTTLLMKVASYYLDKGKKVTILVNEMGEIGVDGATLKSGGYNAVELPNGCICCSLSGTLQNAVREIERDLDPDVMLIEPTGLALPHKVRDLVRTSMIDADYMGIIGVCDAQRFKVFREKKEDFLSMQLRCSDIVLINKTDVATPEELEYTRSWILDLVRGVPVFEVSGKTGDGIDAAFTAMEAMR